MSASTTAPSTAPTAAPPDAAASAASGPSRLRVNRAGLLGLGAGVAALRATVAAAAASRNGLHAPLAAESDRVAHLLRRAGFGFSQAQLDEYSALGYGGAVERLLNYESVPDDVDSRLARHGLNLYNNGDLQRWWLLRMIYTKRPLQEKMTLFWHGLLVSGTGKVGINQPKPENPSPPNHMLNQNHFFREHALGEFGAVVKGVSRDPAMVLYLDNNQNRKGKPNENYARELMELFTLGINGPDGLPNYSENDVREAARAFTGWGLNREQQFAFNPNQHDRGQKTIFGKSGPFNGDDVVDLIGQHPSCAYYVSKRLFEFFAYDSPDPQTLQPLVDVFRGTNGSIKEVLRTLFTLPAFLGEAAYRARAKAPVEYLAHLSRALELETDAFGFQSSAQRMGQQLFNPPNVAGWPGGTHWFNTTTWLERLNQANRILSIRKDDHTQPVDLLSFVRRFALDTPERAVDHFLRLLVDGQVRPEQRQTLVEYARQGNFWKSGQSLRATDPAVDRKLRGLVYLIVAMPEFQLA